VPKVEQVGQVGEAVASDQEDVPRAMDINDGPHWSFAHASHHTPAGSYSQGMKVIRVMCCTYIDNLTSKDQRMFGGGERKIITRVRNFHPPRAHSARKEP
jgi:hypothetical protein